MTAVAIAEREAIIQHVAQGMMLDEVAQSLGIAAPNISKHLARDPEYQQAREIGAEIRLHQSRTALGKLANVSDDIGLHKGQGNLARVREARLRADQWFAEREFPHRWGQRQQIDVTVVVEVGDRLRRALDRECGEDTTLRITDVMTSAIPATNQSGDQADALDGESARVRDEGA